MTTVQCDRSVWVPGKPSQSLKVVRRISRIAAHDLVREFVVILCHEQLLTCDLELCGNLPYNVVRRIQ